MSQKTHSFLIHFSYLFFNITTCFYLEILKFYQIYISQTFTAEMKVPTRIRGENSSMAKVRS